MSWTPSAMSCTAQVDRCPGAVQLIALGVQDIVVKEIAHHPALLVNLRARRASGLQWVIGIGGPSPGMPLRLCGSTSYTENTTKKQRNCHESVMLSGLGEPTL